MKTMFHIETMSLEQIRLTGMEILFQHLGPVGMVRFLQQSETGWGDYTKERHTWLNQEEDIQTLASQIIAQRQSPPNDLRNKTIHQG